MWFSGDNVTEIQTRQQRQRVRGRRKESIKMGVKYMLRQTMSARGSGNRKTKRCDCIDDVKRLTRNERGAIRELKCTVCVENERETDKERLISVWRI